MKALKKEYFLILSLSFLIFFFKWFLSYWNFGTEDVFTKIIFNPYGDHSYYHFVKQLSEFNFSEGYSIFFTKLNLVGFPYLVSIFHAFFYKIFGLYGFIFLEFVFISVFLFIFFFIFKELKFNNIISILLSLIFFSLPQLLYILEGFSIPYTFNLKLLYSSFYSLRFPRPLVTNIFLFAVYLFFIKFYISEDIQKSKKYFYICGMLIGFQFSSFFYFSIVSFITAIFLFYFRAKNTLNLKEIFKSYILFLLIFLLFCLPFLMQLIFIEPDYLGRVGAFEINNENRFYLFQHLLEGFKKIEFILLIILNFL